LIRNEGYSLAELIYLAEANNPETRVAWEGAVAQVGAVGFARSELFPWPRNGPVWIAMPAG